MNTTAKSMLNKICMPQLLIIFCALKRKVQHISCSSETRLCRQTQLGLSEMCGTERGGTEQVLDLRDSVANETEKVRELPQASYLSHPSLFVDDNNPCSFTHTPIRSPKTTEITHYAYRYGSCDK